MIMKTLDTYLTMNYAQLKRLARTYNVLGSILGSPLSNPKIAKNAKENGVLTWPLNLAPEKSSGYQVCANASDGCREACLDTAGNPVYLVAKQKARKAKTVLFFENRPLFVAMLCLELQAAARKASKLDMAMAIRPNTTSDVLWEKYKVNYAGSRISIADLMHTMAPLAKIYDYTKNPNRNVNKAFYTLTFSLSENNDAMALKELQNGTNVAVVFDTKRGQELPLFYTIMGKVWPVINGDLTDYRPEDITPCIVGLRAKGDAIGDKSGFVRPAMQSTFMAA